MTAHPLGKELLPAVPVFRKCRVGICFLKGYNVRIGLLLCVVDTGRGRIEEALYALITRCHQHVRVGQNREHAQCLIVLDETHAAHVRGKLVDGVDARRSPETVFLILQIEREVLDAARGLIPLIKRLDVHGANNLNAISDQMLYQMAADKSTGSAYDGLLSLETHSDTPYLTVWQCARTRLRKAQLVRQPVFVLYAISLSGALRSCQGSGMRLS